MAKNEIRKFSSILDYKELLNSKKLLQTPYLKSAFSTFIENIETLQSSLILPIRLVELGVSDTEFYERFRQVMIDVTREKKKISKDEIEKRMEKLKAVRKVDTLQSSLDILDNVIKTDKEISSTFNTFFFVYTVYTWTIYENFMSDLWRSILNKNASTYGCTAFKDKYEIMSKRFMNLIFENGFKIDISHKLGDYLINYYDFSGVNEIAQAFKKIFGDKLNHVLEQIKKDKNLELLQGFRNSIVHRAGIIDENLISRCKLDAEVGDKLEIDGDLIQKFVSSVINNSLLLIKAIDKILLQS